MQLKKGVFLTLTPIISALVVALSLTIWTFIFDQTKNNEIERARLAIEVSMVDLRQWATELVTGLDKATEYENLLAHEISSENIQDRQSLGNGFVQFSYFLNARIPGIKEIMLLDSDLNLLTHASEGGLLHFRTDQPNLSQAVRDQLNSLYAYMRSRTLDNGIISY
ncbi:MAG: hypothetical protein RLN82_10135, partial [Pseudomonadales bacterium]